MFKKKSSLLLNSFHVHQCSTKILFFSHSPGKLLDSDDQYYRELPISRSEPCVSAEGPAASSSSRRRSFEPEQQSVAPPGRQTRERAVTEPEPHRPARDNRSVLDVQSFLHLLDS